MKYGPRVYSSVIIASGATVSSFVDLGEDSRGYLAVRFTSASTAAELAIYGTPTVSGTGGTYSQIYERVNTAPVQYQALVVGTNTSGGWAVFNAPPFRYIQFLASALVAGGATIYVMAD